MKEKKRKKKSQQRNRWYKEKSKGNFGTEKYHNLRKNLAHNRTAMTEERISAFEVR